MKNNSFKIIVLMTGMVSLSACASVDAEVMMPWRGNYWSQVYSALSAFGVVVLSPMAVGSIAMWWSHRLAGAARHLIAPIAYLTLTTFWVALILPAVFYDDPYAEGLLFGLGGALFFSAYLVMREGVSFTRAVRERLDVEGKRC